MVTTQFVPLPFRPSMTIGRSVLTEAEAAELDQWLDALPPAPEQCEVCRGPASPCIDGRCLACAGELDAALPPPWAHGHAAEAVTA